MAALQVLLVEDNDKNMKLFRDVLQATGYRTLESSTGGLALLLAASHTPALVLMDIQLPDMTGMEAANPRSRLRSNPVIAGAKAA